MAEQRLSYTGERVYVGIDVQKATYTVRCVCQRQIVKTATVPAEPARLAASLSRWFPGATLASVYEAGFAGFVLHRALTTAGITNRVVNPASVAVAANDKVKTDRRDAKKLALALAEGRLHGISIPPAAEELARLLPRTRAQIVEHRATLTRPIKAKRHQFALIAPGSRRVMRNRYLREMATWTLLPNFARGLCCWPTSGALPHANSWRCAACYVSKPTPRRGSKKCIEVFQASARSSHGPSQRKWGI
jgi:transposase